jgi:hypothetical protein
MERVKVLTFCVGGEEDDTVDDTVEGRLEGCRCRIHSASGCCLNYDPNVSLLKVCRSPSRRNDSSAPRSAFVLFQGTGW